MYREKLARLSEAIGADGRRADGVERISEFIDATVLTPRQQAFEVRNDGGTSLGHPASATGAIIATRLSHELARIGGRYDLATTCIGCGQGIALIVECCA